MEKRGQASLIAGTYRCVQSICVQAIVVAVKGRTCVFVEGAVSVILSNIPVFGFIQCYVFDYQEAIEGLGQ